MSAAASPLHPRLPTGALPKVTSRATTRGKCASPLRWGGPLPPPPVRLCLLVPLKVGAAPVLHFLWGELLLPADPLAFSAWAAAEHLVLPARATLASLIMPRGRRWR